MVRQASKQRLTKLKSVCLSSNTGMLVEFSSNISSLVSVGIWTEYDSALISSSDPRSIELKTSI
jgi:hypothetical protein